MAKPRRAKKPNATGRSDTSRFARLDHRILNSNAYRALNPNARTLLVELISLHNGENNGSIWLSVRDATARMGLADTAAASRAFDDLQTLGFIEITKDADFRVKASDTSRARCWRLTWLPGPGRKSASWEFLEKEPPPKTPARKRMERGLRALKAHRKARDADKLPVLDSDTMPPICPDPPTEPVRDSYTASTQNCDFLAHTSVRDSGTYIATTMGSVDCGG
jgi:hypothetical protein